MLYFVQTIFLVLNYQSTSGCKKRKKLAKELVRTSPAKTAPMLKSTKSRMRRRIMTKRVEVRGRRRKVSFYLTFVALYSAFSYNCLPHIASSFVTFPATNISCPTTSSRLLPYAGNRGIAIDLAWDIVLRITTLLCTFKESDIHFSYNTNRFSPTNL